MPVTAGLIIGGASGLLQIGTGVAQKVKAAKLAKNNKRPVLGDNPYVNDMYNITGANASQGLSDNAKGLYTTNDDRNLSSSIDAILRTGGTPNNIGDVYDRSQNGLRQLAMIDDEAKNRNLMQFIEYGIKPKADEKRDQFLVNEMAPYQDTNQLIQQLSEQGMNNIWKGINTGANTALRAVDANMYGNGSAAGQTGSGSGGSFNLSDLRRFRGAERNMGATTNGNGGNTYRPYSLLNSN